MSDSAKVIPFPCPAHRRVRDGMTLEDTAMLAQNWRDAKRETVQPPSDMEPTDAA